MPRFVVLTHDHPHPHWDFMLEAGAALRTWRLEAEPLTSPGGPAVPLPDHRLAYLTYEGPVSGDRGTVAKWDTGEFEWLRDEPQVIEVRLAGARLRGTLRIEPETGTTTWRFYFFAADPVGDQATR